MKRALSQVGRVALVVIAVVALTGSNPEAQSQGRSGRSDAPPLAGAMRGPDAAKAIRAKHAREGKSSADADALVRVLETDESAWVTEDGQMFFADVVFHETPGPGADDGTDPAIALGAPPTPIGYTDAGIPIHHSSPGSVFKLYMDFDGDFLSSFEWRLNRNLIGYSLDFDRATFNHQEQDVISRVWGRLAEDYAPFDIDVTTERPAELERGNPGERNVLWSIFTTTSSAGFPSSVGGVSLFNLDYVPFGTTTPTFVFFNSLGPVDHNTLADVAAQENGHMFGLLHAGLKSGVEYYIGHGTGPTSWGPVMGAPFRRNVTQWTLADYPNGANSPFGGYSTVDHQDEIAIIAGKLGVRADEVGDVPATAPPLALHERHYIQSSDDVDVFALPATGGVELFISGYRDGGSTDGGNLDIAAEIINAAGLVVASVDDHEQTTATLDADLPPGPHFLRVHASSNPANYTTYSSIGEYTVTGAFSNIAPSFTAGAAVSVMPSTSYDAAWATNVSAGPESEAAQHVTFTISGLTHPELFTVPPSIDETGRLHFVAAPGATGTAQGTVVLTDDGGTEHGGVDTSLPSPLRIDVRYQFTGFPAPLPAEVMKAGRNVPVKFALTTASGRMSPSQAAAISAVAELWADASGAGSPLVTQGCAYDSSAQRYQCDLKLPKTLAPGQTYFIAARYLDADGWVLPAGATNPLAFVAK